MALYELIERPDLDEPVLVLALDGWIDAGLSAVGAAAALTEALETVTVARFSTDELLDYRARRPVVHLEDGAVRRLTWPEIELRAAVDTDGNELLLLTGDEPDHLWHRFTDEVVTLALDLGVRLCVGMGAYPFAAPHTRPPRVASAASTDRLADRSLLRASFEFAGGIQAAIEQECDHRGIPALGLWAQIPHYLPTKMPFPAGSLALLESLNAVTGLHLPVGDLPRRAEAIRERLDELIAQNPEHVAMLHQLEAAWDRSGPTAGPLVLTDLPTGDELVAELEEFLRDQRPDGG
ncbi:MAG TPA: PAC2 family protein [Acidimicrobiales bacterium]|nr:PAC2 family protein [Acidimicrobiales bacterium]